jgi:hypothetical protein
MPARSGSKLTALTRLFGALLLVAAAAPVTFEQAFPTAGEPRWLHARVLFLAPDGVHRMELWRDGDARVKRATDAALVSVATHRPGDPAYDLHLLDLKRRISTRVSRDSLYRVGSFTDWFDLTHGLRHPLSRYTVTPTASVPASLPATPEPCRWWDLSQNGRVAHVCWGTRAHLPLLIAGANWRPGWRVVALDTRPIPAAAFTLDDRGFVKNDANGDISPD